MHFYFYKLQVQLSVTLNVIERLVLRRSLLMTITITDYYTKEQNNETKFENKYLNIKVVSLINLLVDRLSFSVINSISQRISCAVVIIKVVVA